MGAISESDLYKITGQAGDLITIEVSSRALRRLTDNGVNGYVDSVLRLFDSRGQLVGFYNSTAVNDDEFESTDSVLMDVRLPATGDYFIEVDTFKSASAFDQAIADQLSGDILQIYIDSTSDTDIGAYELLVYKFAKANSEDSEGGITGDDVLAISNMNFGRVVGGTGTNTLRLDGSELSLDLTTIADNRIRGIERIDITGSGNNILTVNQSEVLNLSGQSDTLIVLRNTGDSVEFGSGWTQVADENIEGGTFSVYTQGTATLKVQRPNRAPTALGLSAVEIAENNLANAVIGTFNATDADTGDTFAYSLAAGAGDTDNAAFSVSGAQLKTNVAFDFEAKSSYSIRVRVTDSGGATFEQAFTINVTNAPEMTQPVQIGDGTAQRSLIRQLVLNFDAPIVFDSGAFVVQKRERNVAGDIVFVDVATQAILASGELKSLLVSMAILRMHSCDCRRKLPVDAQWFADPTSNPQPAVRWKWGRRRGRQLRFGGASGRQLLCSIRRCRWQW